MPRYEPDESFFVDPYPKLRTVLTPSLRKLPSEDIEALFEQSNLSADDLEDFWGSVGNIAKAVAPVAAQVLPVALPAVGTLIGGPVGGMVGGIAGQALGSALSPGQRPSAPQAPSPQMSPAPAQGGNAASQLIATLFRPETLQALMSMALGSAGRSSVSVPVGSGNTPVPNNAFTNLLQVLARQASADYESIATTSHMGSPFYLQNFAGEAIGDPANADSRAAVLYEMLQEADLEGDTSEQVRAYRYSEYAPEANDEMYDQLDLADLYGEYVLF